MTLILIKSALTVSAICLIGSAICSALDWRKTCNALFAASMLIAMAVVLTLLWLL